MDIWREACEAHSRGGNFDRMNCDVGGVSVRPFNWRLCTVCVACSKGFRGRRFVRWDGADMTYEVFLKMEAWHRRISQEMWDDYTHANQLDTM